MSNDKASDDNVDSEDENEENILNGNEGNSNVDIDDKNVKSSNINDIHNNDDEEDSNDDYDESSERDDSSEFCYRNTLNGFKSIGGRNGRYLSWKTTKPTMRKKFIPDTESRNQPTKDNAESHNQLAKKTKKSKSKTRIGRKQTSKPKRKISISDTREHIEEFEEFDESASITDAELGRGFSNDSMPNNSHINPSNDNDNNATNVNTQSNDEDEDAQMVKILSMSYTQLKELQVFASINQNNPEFLRTKVRVCQGYGNYLATILTDCQKRFRDIYDQFMHNNGLYTSGNVNTAVAIIMARFNLCFTPIDHEDTYQDMDDPNESDNIEYNNTYTTFTSNAYKPDEFVDASNSEEPPRKKRRILATHESQSGIIQSVAKQYMNSSTINTSHPEFDEKMSKLNEYLTQIKIEMKAVKDVSDFFHNTSKTFWYYVHRIEHEVKDAGHTIDTQEILKECWTEVQKDIRGSEAER